jgi:DNA-binding transcriptional LysR family regulator
MNAVGGLIGEELIAPLLIKFQQAHPKIDVALDFSSHHVDLMSDKYDLVMRMGDLPDSSLIARRLHSITTRYVASPEFIAKHGELSHPRDLVKIPMICGSVTEWQFVSQDERLSIDFKRGFRIANGRVMLQAAMAGLGVARLADVYVQAAITQGTLLEVLPGWSQSTPLSLVCPPSRYQLQRVKSLMDWLIEQFEPHYIEALHQQH